MRVRDLKAPHISITRVDWPAYVIRRTYARPSHAEESLQRHPFMSSFRRVKRLTHIPSVLQAPLDLLQVDDSNKRSIRYTFRIIRWRAVQQIALQAMQLLHPAFISSAITRSEMTLRSASIVISSPDFTNTKCTRLADAELCLLNRKPVAGGGNFMATMTCRAFP